MKLPARPANLNKTGQEADVKLNTWAVQTFPQKAVYQYDVSQIYNTLPWFRLLTVGQVQVGSGNEKRGTIKKVWDTQAVRTALGPGVIFDGNKLAWSVS